MGQVFGTILSVIIGLFVLYLVIYIAVKDGINKSLVGQWLEKKNSENKGEQTFFDEDLDSDV